MKRSGMRSHVAALIIAIVTCAAWLGLSIVPAWAAAGTVTEFPVKSSPSAITAGPDSALWFTECGAGQIGRISTS